MSRVDWLNHPEYVEFLLDFIPGHTEAEIRAAFDERFGIVLTEANIGNFKYKYKIKSGTHGGCFSKGHIPQNKGKKMPPEVYERCKGTMFKKGNIPPNYRPVGSERLNFDGYWEVKIKDPNVWELKQRVIYREHYKDEIRKDEVVIFLDGNRLNLDPENLRKIKRAELARYNQDHLYGNDPEMNEVALNIAKLKTVKTMRERRKDGTDR